MSDFKAKMHQNPISALEELTGCASPDPLAGFKGPTSKGRGEDRKGRGGGSGREGTGREGGEETGRGAEGTRPHPFTPP